MNRTQTNLHIERMHNLQNGALMAGYFVRNRRNQVVAIGCDPQIAGTGFLIVKSRFERDSDLVRKVEALCGMTARQYRYERWKHVKGFNNNSRRAVLVSDSQPIV